MQIQRVAALILIASATFAGCSSTPVSQPTAKSASAPAPTPAATQAPVTSSAPKPIASSTVATVSLPPHLDPKSLISTERSVFFDFDVFAVKSEYAGLIERHGKYLASKPALAIKIEGNADERGSREYNLALGQKRADAVKRSMQTLGVTEAQIETTSNGEEKPKATGSTEEAWAQNRRADIIYAGENK